MATPRAVPKRSGSSRGKWFFMGVLPIQETIPLQILDPFAELCEVGHTFTAHGSNAVDRRAVIAGIGARRSVFPVGEPHPGMRGAYALCDPAHGVNERLPLHQEHS